MRVVMTIFFLTIGFLASAQTNPPVKFGKISPEDISRNRYELDTNAAAVIIADIGSSKIKGNNKGWFSLEFRIYRRIHILKKEAFDWATIMIPLYKQDQDEEQMKDLRAVTYNLENGKVTESKLNTKSDVYSDKKDKNTVIRKFTLPNVKEGSVIEYSYTISSDFLFNIHPWNFQGEIPCLWSEYTVSLPPFLNYMLISQIVNPFLVKEEKNKRETYVVEVDREVGNLVTKSDRFNIDCTVTDFRWIMKDVPAFKTEPFTSSALNHLERFEFQLAGYHEPLEEKKILTTWPDMTAELLKRDDFGAKLNEASAYWPKELVINEHATEIEKARTVFAFVRDHFTCTDHYQLYLQDALNKIAERKSGGVAEINLLLTAFLRHAGLQADPVILSSRGNMFVNDRYPVATRFNYVITRLVAGGETYLLDATDPITGFGKLPSACYNGTARVVDDKATVVNLSPDMVTELSDTRIDLSLTDKGSWKGNVKQQCDYFSSGSIRRKMSGADIENMQKLLRDQYTNVVTVSGLTADSLRHFDSPVYLRYNVEWEAGQDDRIYLTPVIESKWKQHPFKSATRQYPVEMPYLINETYSIDLAIPKGYVTEEIPKKIIYKLNPKGDAVFEFRVSQENGVIRFLYHLQVKRATFSAEEYEMLRNFFGMVAAKLEEQVVFKKQ